LRSLRARLALAFAVVAVASVVATSLLTGRVATVSMERLMPAADTASRVAAARLARHYARDDGWGDPHAVLDSLARELGRPVVLILPDGAALAGPRDAERGLVVQDRGGELLIQHRRDGAVGEETGLLLRGATFVPDPRGGPARGRVVVFPRIGTPRPTPDQARRAFLRSLAVAAAGVAFVGLVAALLVSRRIAGPVEKLTVAVRRLQAGELGARVTPRGHDELAALAGAFNAMAERVERTERLRRDLVNDVAHELRTPLAHLRGQLEAVQDGLVRPEPAAVGELLSEVEHLTKLVADLQDLAAAETGALRLEREPLDVGAELEAAARPFRARAEGRGVGLELDVAADRPRVMADARRLRQIVTNLLDNALTHAPRGSAVRVSARRNGDVVRLDVRDEGPGIPPEHLAHVFERFYRADASRSRETGGVGLGLAIVRNLAEAHGGSVSVESVPGMGSTFALQLPAISDQVTRAERGD
jgi:signal transduction histidine kinase